MLSFRKSVALREDAHEELFMQRYEQLYRQAVRLTAHDEPLAEDLVQEAFVQFTLARPDLQTINNPDGYLYGMLQKLYISHQRRNSRLQYNSPMLVDYDSPEIGLRTIDPATRIGVQEELRLICHYACVRKASSKAGSVLLLRFFLAYYPSEIARILCSPRNAVDDWLRIARREAKLYLSNPGALSFMTENPVADFPPTGLKNSPIEALNALRRAIFATRHQECFSVAELRSLFLTKEATAPGSPTLAQLVSCPRCLDEVNKLLGIPLLSERNPADMSGPETKSGGTGGSGTGSKSMDNMTQPQRRRARETFEHRPTELHFSVNGYVLSSLSVNAERNEQRQSINLDEKVSFVEVFSEQGVRLLWLDVETPPDGAITQRQQIKLSNERELDLSLDFSGAWPNLHAVYLDPLMTVQHSEVMQAEPEGFSGYELLESHQPFESRRTKGQRLTSFLLRPATITATIAMLLIAALVLVRMPSSTALAAELLNKAAALEKAIEARTDQALHCTINLEERNAADGKLLARRRIEIWHSAEKRATARRVFDERNRLLAGEWRRDNEARRIWRQGEKLNSSPANSLPLAPENIWMLSPSAQDFTALVGNADDAKVADQKDKWLISYESKAKQNGLVSALLILSKDDLHAVEQKLVVRNNASNPALREYRFTETSFERRAPNTVAPAVFEPDAALLVGGTKDEGGRMKDEAVAKVDSILAAPAGTASAELEIEVLDRLNRANALTGEQLSLTRTAEGKLAISGLVETDARKTELLRALDSVAKNPAVRVDIQTVAEAQARQKKQPQQVTTLQQVEITQLTIPVEAELTRHLSARLSGAQLEAEIRRFSHHVLSQAAQARQHALAIKQIAERFSAAELAALDATARQRWHAMLRDRAQALRRTLQQLRQELAPVFPASAAAAQAERAVISDEELSGAVRRLFDLVVATDSGTKKSFSLSTAPTNNAAVETPLYWRNLSQAEALAAGIAEKQ